MKKTHTTYVGTFVKVSGEFRTMRFATSPEKIQKGGMACVWDVEKKALRRFNFSTLVGQLVKVVA
jgi:hypothetical protein